MNLKSMFRSVCKRSSPNFDRVEQRLTEAHRDLRQFAASIDMGYENGTVDLPISNEWTPFCDGVMQVECQLPTERTTLLNVVFQVGATIPRHRHIEQAEEIFVVEGEIEDFETSMTTYAGQVYKIAPMAFHTIHSKTGALVNVLFRPKFRRRQGDKSLVLPELKSKKC